MVRCEAQRTQEANKRTALETLKEKLTERERTGRAQERSQDRKAQVGSGMRGDKIRTIRFQDGKVTDHVTNRSWNLKSYLRGDWD